MQPRPLAVINALGCLALVAVLVHQWAKERRTLDEVARLGSENATILSREETLTREADALRRDIAGLKDALESIRNTALAASAERVRAAVLSDDLEAARAQVGNWETALAARDATIADLNRQLVSSRTKLDEAVVKMRRAGAR